MNTKTYQRRLNEGRQLAKVYRTAAFKLGKYAFEMLEEYKHLTQIELSRLIKVPRGTIQRCVFTYRHALKLNPMIGEKLENTFIVVNDLSRNGVSFKSMTPTKLTLLRESSLLANKKYIRYVASINQLKKCFIDEEIVNQDILYRAKESAEKLLTVVKKKLKTTNAA